MKDRGVRLCAEWLAECLRLGWKRTDLDWLETLWWKYHDEHGRLIEAAPASREESQ